MSSRRSRGLSKEVTSLLELSLCCERDQFQREALAILERAVGFGCALFLAFDRPGGDPLARGSLVLAGLGGTYSSLFRNHAAAFDRELEPVKRFASKHGGAAVDTEVLGRRATEARYYRELVEPAGGGHSLLCYLDLRGDPVGLVMLGRERGRAFREEDLRCARRLRPALALAVASYTESRPQAAANLLSEPGPRLTARERELMDYVARGYTNPEIGLALGTSPNTVRNQLSVLYRKAGATTRAELVGLWSRW